MLLYWKVVARLGPPRGYHPNPNKCELLFPNGSPFCVDPRRFALTAPDGTTSQPRVRIEGVTDQVDVDGAPFELLGAAIGSSQASELLLSARVRKARHLLDEIVLLQDQEPECQ